MAGRRWARGDASEADAAKSRPRPSERAEVGQRPPAPAPPKPAEKPAKRPHPEAMARARRRLEPPKAPWHPLPLSEVGIVLGAVAMLISAAMANGDGIIAGFALVLIGTGEFSWREHRSGFRSHGAVLSGILAFAVGIIGWRVLGLHRSVCIGAGVVMFFAAWGLLDRSYVPVRDREQAAPPA